MVFGGDVAFGRVVDGRASPIGGAAPLAPFATVFDAADLAVVNLECALTDRPTQPGKIRLAAPPSSAAHLAHAGIDLVTLANNHALDAGPSGLDDTLAALRAHGVTPLAGAPVTRRVGPLRVGFIAATDRLNEPLSETNAARIGFRTTRAMSEQLPREVAALAAEVDVVVVLLHWGDELRATPRASQRKLARALIDAGATLVVGHHPHVLQEVERYRDGLIAYSLGNLLFDMRAPVTRQRALLEVGLDARGHLVAARTVALP